MDLRHAWSIQQAVVYVDSLGDPSSDSAACGFLRIFVEVILFVGVYLI